MIRSLKTIILVFIFLAFNKSGFSQIFPSLALAGGPSAGWFFNPVKDLNNELKLAGFPEFSENGYFTLGGGGFIDLPTGKNFLRIGGFGNGFTTKQEKKYGDTLTKAANYSLGLGGLSFEYVKTFGNIFDIHIGAQFATGKLILELYQYGSPYGNYGTIFGELQSNGSSTNLSRVFTSRFYSAQPQLGIGLLLKKFIYLKLDAGYQLAGMGSWRVDNDVEVKNFPKDITSKGFSINLGLNFGLFIRD
ncbi:MAG TPA: hypothetical protein VGK25_05110 [Ignavibacteria bacterium]|jgi:hypothetical protein